MARRRRQIIRLPGFSAVKTGTPSPFADLYYWVMELSWPAFVSITAATFMAINLFFGIVYTLLPGSIANAAHGSLADGIFFSIDTLGTVGYGYMYPATHVAHAIAATEILLGLFFSATITGLIFARFARPRTSLAFADQAVIGPFDGRRALMVRVASTRSRPLADASAQMSWLETVHLPGGGTYRALADLELMRSRNPMLGLAWTLVHPLRDDSPLLAALNGTDRFLLTVTISGTDTLLASQSLGGHRYRREDILIDHEFVDILTERDDVMYLDMANLHATRPLGADIRP